MSTLTIHVWKELTSCEHESLSKHNKRPKIDSEICTTTNHSTKMRQQQKMKTNIKYGTPRIQRQMNPQTKRLCVACTDLIQTLFLRIPLKLLLNGDI